MHFSMIPLIICYSDSLLTLKFVGNVNMVERTNEQQRLLEKQKADLAERRRIEIETAHQLEATEEMGEELGKTYTSLQQEVLLWLA